MIYVEYPDNQGLSPGVH
uniref:Uncharacterized protein n=1 Tax=Anguilla anguilla TaxID=7936 RepID=A0A0E9T555_ANGAN